MRILRHPGRSLLFTLAAILLAILIGATVPRPGTLQDAPDARRTPGMPNNITIYIASNGFHTGLIVPAAAAGENWGEIVRATDLPDPDDAGGWLMFGWGDREFYLNTPQWQDVRAQTALAALFGSRSTLVHVDHLRDPADVVDPRPIRLSMAAYRRLTAYLRASMRLDGDSRPVAMPGYGDRDVFYEGHGAYSAITTCNVWTASALNAAGVRVGLWTPMAHDLMRWFPASALDQRDEQH